ncbi:hypothetical protein Q4E93_22985 [Flavitalea sp. BT771]|uniref:hypothetical protein n=1 Tax=Flavitalea sp. BT771 TaxID=3063329 RepID=UPI0026E2B7A5|nr:hypothetical protein [Flavitalea sp. BT771]MDO6433497.1 hypothetical protein [Flavitalea sp. BT771]MDV6222598.1 hypothetical protein [Flavitalea sp. BT771]
MNIAACAGKRSRRILLINKKATGMGVTGFVWNATINIFEDPYNLMKKTDEFIESKLIWKAKQYSLPTEFAFYFNDLSNDIQVPFLAQIDILTSGKPVLLFTRRTEEWTLICTRQVIGRDKKGIIKLNFKDIKQIFSAEIDPVLKHQSVDLKSIKPKKEWNEITIIDRSDLSHTFYADSGSDLLSLWNILLMAKRLNTE